MSSIGFTYRLRMLSRHINYFLAVAEHGSFTRAASALHVSQPALSQQIRQLEESLGVPLFDRSGRTIRLTDAGEVWRQYASRALQELGAGKRAIHDVADLTRGSHFVPKIKLSENVEKVTNPGNKTVYRIYDKATGKIRADLICLADETFDTDRDMIIFDPMATWKKTKIAGGTYALRELLVPVFLKGECVYTSPSVMEIRDICAKEKETLWSETMRLVNPQEVYVDLSDKLYAIKSRLLEEMGEAAIE